MLLASSRQAGRPGSREHAVIRVAARDLQLLVAQGLSNIFLARHRHILQARTGMKTAGALLRSAR